MAVGTPAQAAAVDSLDSARLASALQTIPFDGRLGVCVALADAAPVCTHGEERFSLQSVMKLVVAVAVLDAVDAGRMKLDDPVTIHRSDLSVFVQPIEKLVGPDGWTTTVRDLMHRAVTESDSAAVDSLLERIGGPAAVNAVLAARGITGMRIDRDERHLQSDIVGVTWTQALGEPSAFAAAIAAVPKAKRDAAYKAYVVDARDTSTPRAMLTLLQKLAAGTLLSPTSTKVLRDTMAATVTGTHRLRAGFPATWRLEHKTGTSGAWDGLTAATNDVGIAVTPSGESVSVVVFAGDSRASETDRDAAIAAVARAVVASYRPR